MGSGETTLLWYLGWWPSVICTIVSLRGAQVFATGHPRIYSAIALFAANWAVLIAFYSTPESIELLPALSGFLLTYCGSLLRREAAVRESEGNVYRVSSQERWAVRLLAFIALPSLFVPGAADSIHFDLITRRHLEITVSVLITIAGFAAIIDGFRRLVKDSSWKVMAWILGVYSLAEITAVQDKSPTES